MTAPRRPPSFFDSLTGRDSVPPVALREAGFLLDSLAADARLWPHWLLDDDSRRRIALRVVEHVPERRAVIGFALAGLDGTITATPDPSGYLRLDVSAAGAVLTAYLERIWEEHELWPPGAAAGPDEDAPGRLGKHRSWVSISATGWPLLAGIANAAGWLNLRQLEEPAEPSSPGG